MPAPAGSTAPGTTPSAVTGTAGLTVGDNRQLTLISLGGARTDALLTRVAADMGGAVAQVESFWGDDWSHDILIVATDSDAQFAAQSQGLTGAGGADIAAVAVADRVDAEHRSVSGQRIVLAPGAATMGAGALRIVLGHELFHYASRADTALDAPRWLTEGVADFVSRPAPPLRNAYGMPTALPSDADFAVSGPQLSSAYDRAWMFTRFVAESYGVPRLREVYQRACGPGHPDTAIALRDVLGAGPAELLISWQRWTAG